jgi:N-sulfoglucosamine sulfohydrolase
MIQTDKSINVVLSWLMVLAGLVATVAAEQAKTSRPNILFIHMEDMGCQIPPYGDHTQATPALSRLAEEGMVFEHVNVTAPSCAPSRGSLFTGLYPHQNGMWAFDQTHGFHYRKGVPTFVKLLKENGYRTGISYKKGVEPKDAVPFDENYNYNKSPFGKEPKGAKVSNCIDGFEHFLKAQPQGQPFYFQAQTNDTHVVWAPDYEPIRGEKSRFGLNPVDPKAMKPLPHWGDLVLSDKMRKYLATYYGSIQRVDYFVDKILALLKRYGHEENTIVFFTSDHGPSDLYRGKITSYEFGLKVPFIVKWPGVVAKSQRSSALVSFVDIMPTFLDCAGLAIPDYLPGHSLVSTLKGETPQGTRRFMYSAYNSHTTGEKNYWPARTITDGRYKLIHNLLGDGERERPGTNGANYRMLSMFEASPYGQSLFKGFNCPPEYELFDLQNDRGELNDLSDKPEYASVLRKMKSSLKSWRKEVVNDPLLDQDVLDAFSKDYFEGCKKWTEKMYPDGLDQPSKKKEVQKEGWSLDKSRWIEDWDPSPYCRES